MLNIFVHSSTYGQAMAATFDLEAAGSLPEKRITAPENCCVAAPVYEKPVDQAKVVAFATANKRAELNKMMAAIDTENRRVNSLAALIRELKTIIASGNNDMIIAHVPAPLLKEIETGRVKFSLIEGAEKNPYFSDFELELWREALPLIQQLYTRIVFKSIDTCKTNAYNQPVQALRVAIYRQMHQMILAAFNEMKQAREFAQQNDVSFETSESAFA